MPPRSKTVPTLHVEHEGIHLDIIAPVAAKKDASLSDEVGSAATADLAAVLDGVTDRLPSSMYLCYLAGFLATVFFIVAATTCFATYINPSSDWGSRISGNLVVHASLYCYFRKVFNYVYTPGEDWAFLDPEQSAGTAWLFWIAITLVSATTCWIFDSARNCRGISPYEDWHADPLGISGLVIYRFGCIVLLAGGVVFQMHKDGPFVFAHAVRRARSDWGRFVPERM